MTLYLAPASAFLNDWGIPVAFGAVNAVGIFDEPTAVIEGGMVVSTNYKLTYATGALPGLDSSSSVTVSGVVYRVRDVRTLADGAFSEAIMEKV